MTRHQFGQSPSDWAFTVGAGDTAVLAGGVTLTMWDLPTSGTQITDLLDSAGSPITSVITADGLSGLPIGTIPLFYGPDTVTALWADAGGGYRARITAHDAYAPDDDVRFGQIAGLTVSGSAAAGLYPRASSGSGVTWTADGTTSWLNVKSPAYAGGAKGDGTTDDYAAIQAAITACPRGGTVYFPVGVYRTSAPLTLPPRTTLRGAYAPHWPQYAKDNPSVSACIKALSGFTGTALVKMLDKAQGGWAEDYMSSARITDLTLDGGGYGSSVAGIYASGQVVDIALTGVCIHQTSGHGLYTDTYGGLQPKGWQLSRVAVQSAGGSGYYHANTGSAPFAVTDMTYESCWAGAGASDGWHFESALSVDLVGCRSEFNAGYGYYAAGNSRMRWVDCDTDRSTKSGWRLECTGAGTRSIILAGCVANRDGCNDDITPAGYAGIDIVGTSGTAHNPVTISGCVINTNRNDAGGGIYSPDYGLKMTYAPQVSVSATLLNGTVASLLDSQKQAVYNNTTRFNTTSPSTGAVTLEQANTQRLNGAAGTNRDIEFWTATVGKRWAARTSSTAETGSNAGSNFGIVRYDDSGTVIDTPLSISRATGVVTATTGLTTTGNALGQPQPGNHNVAAWSSDPTHNINASLLTNGTVYLTAVYPAATVAITKIYLHLTAAAVTPTAGRNEVGIYSSAGVLLASVNVDSLITSTGLLTATIASTSLNAAAAYWVGMVFNAATAPTLARAGQQTGASTVHNLGLTAATYRYATNAVAQNTLPASITPASNASPAFAGPWGAIG